MTELRYDSGGHLIATVLAYSCTMYYTSYLYIWLSIIFILFVVLNLSYFIFEEEETRRRSSSKFFLVCVALILF